jgi:excisionase family DNA binding protein
MNYPISTEEAARRLGISTMGVGHAIRRGSLKAVRLGCAYMITEEEVERYRRDHARKPLVLTKD